MRTSHALLSVLLIAIVSCSCDQSAIQPKILDSELPTVSMPVDAMALIEHRGRFYRVEDLTDPAFVAQSEDPFVKGFAANRTVAVQWAGIIASDMNKLD